MVIHLQYEERCRQSAFNKLNKQSWFLDQNSIAAKSLTNGFVIHKTEDWRFFGRQISLPQPKITPFRFFGRRQQQAWFFFKHEILFFYFVDTKPFPWAAVTVSHCFRLVKCSLVLVDMPVAGKDENAWQCATETTESAELPAQFVSHHPKVVRSP